MVSDALNTRRYSEANDQFNSLEQNYPFSTWAVNAQVMQGYSEYLQNKYTDAIATLDRFHPVASRAPGDRLHLLPVRALLLRANRR